LNLQHGNARKQQCPEERDFERKFNGSESSQRYIVEEDLPSCEDITERENRVGSKHYLELSTSKTIAAPPRDDDYCEARK